MPKKIKINSRMEREAFEDMSLVDMVSVRRQNSQNYLINYWDKWRDYYQLYRSIPNNAYQSYVGRANLFVPYVYSTIETIIPRLTANQPKAQVAPRRPTDLRGAKLNQILFDYYWQRQRMKAKFKLWVKEGLLYGTGVVKTVWNSVKDEPETFVVDLAGGSIFFDPTNTNLNDPSMWWIHEYEESIDDILENPNYEIPGFLKRDDELIVEGGKDDAVGNYYKDFREYVQGKTPGKDSEARVGKIWEFWGLVDNKPWLISVLDGKYLIRNEANPYEHGRPPFVVWVDIPVAHEPLGIGEVEPIERLQYELNDVRNQRMDNVTQNLHQMWKIHKGADIDESELVWRPNGVLHTDLMEGIEPIQVPDMTRSAYNEESLIKQDIEVASGVNDFNRGVQGDGASDTARGLMLQQEVANARFQAKLDNIEDGLIILGEMQLANIQQFMPESKVIRITDNKQVKWREFSKKEIQGQFDLVIEMGATQPMNKEVRRANARELIATVAPYLQTMPDGANKLNRYLKYLEETYDLTNDLEEEGAPAVGLAPFTPQASTPGQAGPLLAANEAIYGQQGADLGGAPAGQTAPELRGLL